MGSEMCIRDSYTTLPAALGELPLFTAPWLSTLAETSMGQRSQAARGTASTVLAAAWCTKSPPEGPPFDNLVGVHVPAGIFYLSESDWLSHILVRIESPPLTEGH